MAKSGIADLNETLDKLTGNDQSKVKRGAKAVTSDGRARAGCKSEVGNHGRFNLGADASAAGLKGANHEAFVAGAKTDCQFGYAGFDANAGAELEVLQLGDENLNLDIGKADLGVGVSAGAGYKAKINAGVTVVGANAKFGTGQEASAKFRPNLDTGYDVGAGSVGVTVAGWGGSIGRRVAIGTPLGGFSVKLW